MLQKILDILGVHYRGGSGLSDTTNALVVKELCAMASELLPHGLQNTLDALGAHVRGESWTTGQERTRAINDSAAKASRLLQERYDEERCSQP